LLPYERQQALGITEDLLSSFYELRERPPPGVAALWIKGLAGQKNADRHDRPFHGLTDRGRPEEDTYARPHRADRTSRSCHTESSKNCLPIRDGKPGATEEVARIPAGFPSLRACPRASRSGIILRCRKAGATLNVPD
jgi:hypothetical protein